MKILFVLCFLFSIAAPLALYCSYKGEQTKSKKNLSKICSVICIAVVAAGFIDFTGSVKKSPFHGAFVLMAYAVTIQLVIICLNSKKQYKTLNFARKAVLVALFLEMTVFQLPSYPTIFNGKYKTRTIESKSMTFTAPTGTAKTSIDGVSVKGNQEVLFELNNVDVPVKSIKLDTWMSKKTNSITAYFDISDETSSTYRTGIASGKIIDGADCSKYIPVNMSGTVNKMKIRLYGSTENDYYALKSITLNAPVPFNIYPVRIVLIVVLSVLAYAIVNSSVLGAETIAKKRLFQAAVAVLTVFALFISWKVATMRLPDGGWKKQMKLEHGDQMTQELVDAFEDKKLDLNIDVSSELTALENPYDWGARDGVSYAWDHLLYDGKYYSYYGIAPVVLVFMPYHKITGYYFSVNLAVLLFSIIGIIFLGMTYYEFIKRFFPKIPLGCSVAGYIVMLIACGIWYNVYWALFYMTAISSGFMFITMGAYFLISSGIFGREKISLVRTALSSLFIGLAVLSRPTLAVYAICVYIIYAMNLKQSMYVSEEKSVKSRRISYALCGGLPLAFLGIAQMAYNFARFGSPLDFGIKYSLTINDFIHSEFHLVFMMLGLFHYLIAPPVFRASYPYVLTEFNYFDANGYYYRCPETVSGIIFMALPVLGYFFSARALRRLPDRKSRLKALAAVGLPCVVMPIVIICSVWESGYAIRYIADFAWEMIIGALAVLFWLYLKSNNETKKKMFKRFMAFSVVAAVILNCPQIFNYWFSENDFPVLCAEYRDMISFWR